MRFLIASLITVSLMGCSGQKDGVGGGDVVLDTEVDSLSYSYGADVGRKIKGQLDAMELELNPEAVTAAVKDVMMSGDLRMTDDEMKMVFMNYSQKREQQSSSADDGGGGEAAANLEAGNAFLTENGTKDGVVALESGLQYRVIAAGAGASPTASDQVTVHYAGTLLDGTEFDSSYKREQPATFPLTGVIKGWTEGLQYMNVGATYEFFIPAHLAYGSKGRPSIPANSTLIFKVELIKIN